jgi:hypothetical protein
VTTSAYEIATASGVHRYAIEHWPLLRPFVEGMGSDPKDAFILSSDTWSFWPYARNATPSQAGNYRISFGHLSSFLKPFVKWYCYQHLLQRAGDVRVHLKWLPNQFRQVDDYLTSHGYVTLDDLAASTVFDDLWKSLLPPKDPPFTSQDVRRQSVTRSFWLQIHTVFGIPLLVPPVAPAVRRVFAETGNDERAVIPQPVIAQLMNKLALHREGVERLNRFHHLRLCVLLLNICLGRRMNEILLAPRGEGPEGPLTTYPAQGKDEEGSLWFCFEPNKDGRQNQVYISSAWHDLASYCVKILLFYSDEVRHLALPEEQHFFILISTWNLTARTTAAHSPATELDTDYEHFHLNKQNEKRNLQVSCPQTRPLSYKSFESWLSGNGIGETNHHWPSIFFQWKITTDGKADGEIYHMRTQQARHTRQTALARDPNIPPLIRQRDLNHSSRDMQLVYQHHLKQENAKLRERIAQRKLHGLGTNWLEESLGMVEPGAPSAFREGSPSLLDPRWRALIVNNPQFIQANRVSCGLCAFPQGPEGCPEFMHCTEATDEGCAWFLTNPNDLQMQRELQQRANEHRTKQQESIATGRTVQAHKYGVMAERTERLRNEGLQKASDEVCQALLSELNTYEEQS